MQLLFFCAMAFKQPQIFSLVMIKPKVNRVSQTSITKRTSII